MNEWLNENMNNWENYACVELCNDLDEQQFGHRNYNYFILLNKNTKQFHHLCLHFSLCTIVLNNGKILFQRTQEKRYKTPKEFKEEAQWMLHNSIIYFGGKKILVCSAVFCIHKKEKCVWSFTFLINSFCLFLHLSLNTYFYTDVANEKEARGKYIKTDRHLTTSMFVCEEDTDRQTDRHI